MEVSQVLKDIPLNKEQQKGLKTFLEQFKEEIESDVIASYEEDIKELEQTNEELQSKLDNIDSLYSPENVERAFELAFEDAEAEKKRVYENGKKAAELMVEDLTEEYTKKFAEGLQELYGEVETKLQSEYQESGEFKALGKIKDAIKEVDNDIEDLTQEKIDLQEEINDLKGDRDNLTRDNVIDTLCDDVPEEYQEEVRKLISGAKDIDSIYERFNSAMDFIEKGLSSEKNFRKSDDDETVIGEDEDAETDDEDEIIVEDEQPSDDEKNNDDDDEWLEKIFLTNQAV